jgi:RNA polymerase sigma factor (sigma-70 family)
VPNAHLERSEATSPDWGLLVKGIRNKDAAAFEKFYEIFAPGIRFFAMRQLWGQDAAADCSSQCLMLALEGIGEGRLREPAAIAEYVLGILRNLIRKTLAVRIDDRGRQTDQVIEFLPNRTLSREDYAILVQQQQSVRKALAAMRPMDREILRLFYVDGFSATKIQHDLGITPTQFRLIKNRAKATLVQEVSPTVPPVV